ncbi:hypothetical protein SAMN05660226_02786 [Parapedobacter luteus]|uniref:DUF115 domain-containing protein n=1 Tax=Parapedobacter luteus TaxID=623280 RepID=A0A1T5DFM9_9SPHI|nr:hypothetical protein [Parapedobacter luteus]SKB70548.1 hypothetical protein SAMN05660226_02786 [Parapedobacter luteus]
MTKPPISDKIKRGFTGLTLLGKMYRFIAGDWRRLNWLKEHRQNGVPFEWSKNNDYLDWFYKYRPHLAKFKDIHKGQDCFIIGNGPSLNQTDLNLLNGYHVFGLNKIHLIFEKYPRLKLSYHVTVNPLVIEQIQREVEEGVFDCPTFLSYQGSKGVNFSSKNVYKLLTCGKWSFYKNVMEPINEGYTVTYVAMQLAYYMGYKNVFLVGVDHNFSQVGKPNELQDFKGDDHNHFHPDYFKGQLWHLADLEGNEASYALAKHQFHEDGREIFNATVGGKLNIFKRITFEEALQRAKKMPE